MSLPRWILSPDPSSAGLAAPPALRPGAEPHSLVGSDPVAVLPVSLFVGYIERRRSPLDPVLRSLVSARIAQLCHCEFCIDITSMTLAARSGSQDKLLAVADWRSSTLFSEKSAWRWPMPKPPPRRRRRWMMPCVARWPRILTPGRSPS